MNPRHHVGMCVGTLALGVAVMLGVTGCNQIIGIDEPKDPAGTSSGTGAGTGTGTGTATGKDLKGFLGKWRNTSVSLLVCGNIQPIDPNTDLMTVSAGSSSDLQTSDGTCTLAFNVAADGVTANITRAQTCTDGSIGQNYTTLSFKVVSDGAGVARGAGTLSGLNCACSPCTFTLEQDYAKVP